MALSQNRLRIIQTEIDRLASALARTVSPRRIVLFGSWAWGLPNEWSDIDLLVVRETAENFWDRQATLRRLVEPQEPVDFLVLTPAELEERLQLGDPFVRDICERGRVLHDA